ncbi:hypothetical protein [Varunaivibrio sulfuroxidans]|uniref:Uncharacterized protein n=1 Tax=Varunaivibrio sulfuroxidans TaxID=1773489 RepID=A0A4R3JD96_9PROT|nr:hypothetical protein [Varunaivibrio sulfuroxidans]TCS63166.1 hypothetical protein EDD55_104260 [Varunaivibrio sulfuroxidans]WES31772.1 hypothetical protein P3M64_05265 [Varunaivibrio sulfuroxidans]
MMLRTTSFLIFAVIALSAVSPRPAMAQLPGENNHIQMKFIMAPVKDYKGRSRGPMPVTPVMTVPRADDAAIVCQSAPRINDAIIGVFFSHPLILQRDGHLQLDGAGPKLVGPINRALGKAMVSEVFLIQGGKKLGKGVMASLPFATTQGCGRVLDEYEARMKKLKGE